MYLGLDFGGTKLTAVAHHANSFERHALARRPSPPRANAQYDIETMIELAHEVLDSHSPTGIGVSFGGPVDASSGLVKLSHHVPGWENIPLQQQLEDSFSVPTLVDNDGNVGALGEWRFGAGRGFNSLMYITVSTGVGAGIILNDAIWHGRSSMAGEIGHMTIDPAGPLCLCGKPGCVERFASGPYMAKDLHALQPPDSPAISGREVAELAAAGQPDARAILRRGARAIGVGIGNVANLLDLQCFVLGGGVTKSGDIWWKEVQAAARQTALPEIELNIQPAHHIDDAPLWGAIALAEQAVSLLG